MTVRTVLAGAQEWRFAPDNEPASAERSQAMMQAMLVDEVLNAPPDTPLHVFTRVFGAIGRAAGGGRVGVVGRPAQAFHAPTVALSQMDLTVTAPGFLPLTLTRPVGPQPPDYPVNFTPVNAGTLALHRTATRIRGRVVSLSGGAVAGASVRISGVWPVLQDIANPADAPDAMPLYAGLYADRPTGNVRRRNLTPAAQVKALERPAMSGDTVVRLSDRQSISAGQILAIDFGDVGRVEYIGISVIDLGSDPDQPADVTLDLPLRRDHAERTPAARAMPSGAGPANPIARPARAGDATIWTTGLNGIGPGTTAIEIDGGGAPTEYQAAGTYTTTANSEGDFALPPIHRIAAVELTVSQPGPPQIVRSVSLVWASAEQVEDFLFP